MKKLIYIAHPIGGDIENNLEDLRRILRTINLDIHPKKYDEKDLGFDFSNVHAYATYYADIVSLEDFNPAEREIGINNDIALIKTGVFDELWLTGKVVSKGMQAEKELFESLGITVKDYIGLI